MSKKDKTKNINHEEIENEDFVFEDNNEEIKDEFLDSEIEDGSTTTTATIKKLKKELKNCQKERKEFLDGWQRTKADYANLKRRSEDDKNKIRDYGIEDFSFKLIPIIDNFEMAFKNEEVWNQAPENWRIGVKFIYDQMINVFKEHQINQVDPLNEKFDPEFHHSIETIPVDDKKQDGIVVEVQQKGYKLKDKLIRPATVKVGEFKEL